ncbi:hypothetical protein PABG_05798 [Paracoccidioides brasiliensis Pb03]|nr:hypothetical protein PABG_05798 [Paracoccidioides brasiliensis Pb03]
MSSSNNPEPQSTTSSYVEQASNAIKNTISKVTGGTTSQDDKDKDTKPQPPPRGQYNQTVGSAKQTVGAAIGNDNLRKAGERQNAEGENQEARRQAHEWAEGAGDRVTGKVGELLSGPGFGGSDEDRMKAEAERRKFKQMHEEGKLQQKSAEEDIDQRWGGDDK